MVACTPATYELKGPDMGFLERFLGGHHRGGDHGARKGYEYGGAGSAHGPAPAGWGTDCPSCRATNPPQAKFCQQCGTPMAPFACGQCSTMLQAGAKFCGQCGKAV